MRQKKVLVTSLHLAVILTLFKEIIEKILKICVEVLLLLNSIEYNRNQFMSGAVRLG